MTWDDALRTVTLAPPRRRGSRDRYGSLERGESGQRGGVVGRSARAFVSRAEHLFIRGPAVPLASRQTELLQRYRKLPPAY